MFERYTEKTRRVIFFARYEASQFGSPYIESEHLLLGLLREDKALIVRFLRSKKSLEDIRKQIENHTVAREKTSTSVDLPLSSESKRILAYAAEAAETFGHKHIGTGHLLFGILREERCFAAQLVLQYGCTLEEAREWLAIERYQDQQQMPGKRAYLGVGSSTDPSFRIIRGDASNSPKIVLVTPERQEIVELPGESLIIPRVGENIRVGALSFHVTGVEYVYEGPMKPLRKIRLIVDSA